MPIADAAAVNGSDVRFECEVQTAVADNEELRFIKVNSLG